MEAKIIALLVALGLEQAAMVALLRAYKKSLKNLISNCLCILWKKSTSARFAKAFSATLYSSKSAAIECVRRVFQNLQGKSAMLTHKVTFMSRIVLVSMLESDVLFICDNGCGFNI